jgi:hypothetical protein
MENFTNKKYVVLEHLLLPDRGMRFWSSNTENNTHLHDGTLAYKEILFTDDDKAAILASGEVNIKALPSMHELEEYYNNLLYMEEHEN